MASCADGRHAKDECQVPPGPVPVPGHGVNRQAVCRLSVPPASKGE